MRRPHFPLRLPLVGHVVVYAYIYVFVNHGAYKKNKSDHKIKQNKRQQRQAGIYRILTCFCLFIKNGYDILEHIEYQVVVDNGFMTGERAENGKGILECC